jgi:hypothetical protein
VVWGILSTRHTSFVSPEKANAHSYRALKDRLHELAARLGISDFSELQKKSLTAEEKQRAARIDLDEPYALSTLIALDEAYTSYMHISAEIQESATDLRWMLGSGYIEAWKTFHRAEEALVRFEPVAQVIRGTICTHVRVQRSSIGNRIYLLRKSRQAVKNADNTAKLAMVTSSVSRNAPFHEQKAMVSTPLVAVEDKEAITSNASVREQQVMARIASRTVKHVFNKYRDDLWQELIQKRNLLLGQIFVIGIATYILLCFGIFLSNTTVIIEATACYVIGSAPGLIGPSYRALKRNTSIDDYGLSRTYMLASCLFSGLVAVFGLLAIGRLDIPNISLVDLFINWLRFFRSDQLANLLIAVVFGLLSNLYFRRLLQKVTKIETELLRSKAPPPGEVVLSIPSTASRK